VGLIGAAKLDQWTLSIAITEQFFASSSANPIADYSSGQENEYFGWNDAAEDDARSLADKFVERFDRLAARRAEGGTIRTLAGTCTCSA
jgi:hypothetical protein